MGFTLIELLVTFSLVSLFAASSIIGVSKYNERQILRNAALELRGTLIDAKARAQSQVKPESLCTTGEKLDGYKVQICDLEATNCSLGNYEIHVVCAGIDHEVPGSGKKLPNKIMFSTASDVSSIFFKVLNAGVVGTGNIVLTGYGDQATISVDANGNISIN